ncbi:hypothetical protein K2173_013438 [Erythroxylum novogranatense]|uniref:Uncharacterized protein n=1 Tax=Erythroxylum novogranatense TaxID=1862640 RepID=A0AAV8SAD0_9ROSI|nr:hypothetical protein K2173_013438 [Erythroxylum novogranatense]
MRIRKNTNLSSLMTSSGAEVLLQTHVCQLNQSPWDVIPFSQEAYPFSLSQFEGEDSFNGNGSLGDSIGGVESVASMMVDAEEKPPTNLKIDNKFIDDDNNPLKKGVFEEVKLAKTGRKVRRRNKNDGKEDYPKGRYSMNYNRSNALAASPGLSIKKQEKALTGSLRTRAKSAKKGSSSSNSNPYEFYYYSGFGPLWGKRRGGGGDRGEANKTTDTKSDDAITGTTDNTTPSSSSSPIGDNNSFDYVDDEEDEEEEEEELEDNENGDISKKRMRKPVKARSLRSLM